MRVAALDLGTNSFICLVAEGDTSGIKTVLYDEISVVKLGQEVGQNGFFHPEALLRASDCLRYFKEKIDPYNPEKILALATSAARDASNGNELLLLGKKFGIPIRIIEGHEEAELTYLGAISGEVNAKDNTNKSTLVIDIGGGSTELILGIGSQIHFSQSINIGCVRLTEKFITKQPVSFNDWNLAKNEIIKSLDASIDKIRDQQIDRIVAVGGTPTSIVSSQLGGYVKDKVEGFELTVSNCEQWLDKFSNSTIDEKFEQWRLNKGRADVIFAGTLILHTILEKLKMQSTIVSTRGVRYGIAEKLFRK